MGAAPRVKICDEGLVKNKAVYVGRYRSLIAICEGEELKRLV